MFVLLEFAVQHGLADDETENRDLNWRKAALLLALEGRRAAGSLKSSGEPASQFAQILGRAARRCGSTRPSFRVSYGFVGAGPLGALVLAFPCAGPPLLS